MKHKSLKDHGFFREIAAAEALGKKIGAQGFMTLGRRNKLYDALKRAHPFVFDRRVTIENRLAGRSCADVESLVESFSLPRSTSLYLMTDSPSIQAPIHEGAKERGTFTLYGYLIDEISPEEFLCWEVNHAEVQGYEIPYINAFTINLKDIEKTIKMARALDAEVFGAKTEAHTLKEISCVLRFTECISVKRIGVEVRPSHFNIKTKGIGAGITTFKYDNIIHIADKEEYEYTKPIEDSPINWEYAGHWRGHWRAFYIQGLKDQFGRNVVDYTRTGKDRAGVYKIPGYTWVTEHTRGDKDIADIKTRTVKHDPTNKGDE